VTGVGTNVGVIAERLGEQPVVNIKINTIVIFEIIILIKPPYLC
jgi:hypothetical protein